MTEMYLPTFAGDKKNNPVNEITRFHYYRLWGIITKLRKWVNVPDDLNIRYIEWALHEYGFVNAVTLDDGKPFIYQGTVLDRDAYEYPLKLSINNRVYQIQNAIEGKTGVFIPNNTAALPVTKTLMFYARQLAEIDIDIKINLDNCKISKVFYADTPEQAKQLKKLNDDVMMGRPAVITETDNIVKLLQENGGKLPVYATPEEMYIAELITAKQQIFNEFLSNFGIDVSAANAVKAERNTNEEVHSNDQFLKIQRDYWIEPVNTAMQKFNQIFGTNISVEFNTDAFEEEPPEEEPPAEEPPAEEPPAEEPHKDGDIDD